ncbi:MAG: hypothetical protein ACTSPB_08430 [Candidatus Thorarchaeota archaeon]
MNTVHAVDGLGQPVSVGDKVIWMSGTGSYGGVKIYIVRGITAKRFALSSQEVMRRCVPADCVPRPTYAAHDVVIVINKLLNEHDEIDL